jgi:hypothetical protein
VLSSRYEGLGNVLIEALACGTPVVSTDCPSGPAEVLDNGRFGPLVPVGDVAALARAIEGVLDDPPAAQSLRARARSFTVERAVDRYLGLLFPAQDEMDRGLAQPPNATSKAWAASLGTGSLIDSAGKVSGLASCSGASRASLAPRCNNSMMGKARR